MRPKSTRPRQEPARGVICNNTMPQVRISVACRKEYQTKNVRLGAPTYGPRARCAQSGPAIVAAPGAENGALHSCVQTTKPQTRRAARSGANQVAEVLRRRFSPQIRLRLSVATKANRIEAWTFFQSAALDPNRPEVCCALSPANPIETQCVAPVMGKRSRPTSGQRAANLRDLAFAVGKPIRGVCSGNCRPIVLQKHRKHALAELVSRKFFVPLKRGNLRRATALAVTSTVISRRPRIGRFAAD